MRRLLALVLTALLTAGLLGATAGPSTAAANKLKIQKIKAKKANYGKKTTIKPKVTRAGNVELLSAKLTVKQRGKTIAKNRNKVKLRAGKYRVKTTLKYRTWQNRTRNVQQVRKTLDAYLTERYMACRITNSGADFGVACTNASAFTGTYYTRGYALDDGNGNWTGYMTDAPDLTLSLGTNVNAIVGRKFSAYVTPTRDLYKRVTVRQSYRAFSGVKTKKRSQVLVVKQKAKKKKPSSGGGSGGGNGGGSSNAGLDPRFDWCYEANDAGYGNYVQGVDPEYDWYEDRDNDGIVCEF